MFFVKAGVIKTVGCVFDYTLSSEKSLLIEIRVAVIRKRKTSALTTGIVITVWATMLQHTPSLASSGDTVGFGTAASMGAAPPKSQTVDAGSNQVASSTGAYKYQFPIVVPPGRLGMQPKLSLSYNSQGRIYGGVASHWSLAIPEIRGDYSEGRLDQDIELPWTSGLAGGSRLVSVVEPSSTGSSPFRVEVDSSYTRYEKFPGSNQTGPLWIARSLDGTIRYFGDSNNIRDRGNAPVYLGDRAPLTREEDRFGNTVDYYWRSSQGGGSNTSPDRYHIERIEYTKNRSVAGGAPFAEVFFYYGPAVYCFGSALAVGASSDHHGAVLRIQGDQPLNNIVMSVVDEPGDAMREVHRVQLEYNSRPCSPNLSPIRQLVSITETGTTKLGVQTSSNPVRFTYGPTALPYDALTSFDASGPATGSTLHPSALAWGKRSVSDLGNTTESMLIDLDGDGRLDRVFSNGAYKGKSAKSSPSGTSFNGCGMVWLRNEGDKFSSDTISSSSSALPIKLPRVDWRYGESEPGNGESCSLTGQVTAVKNTNPANLCGSLNTTRLLYNFMDVDSDGRPDLVISLNYDSTFYKPANDTSWPPMPWNQNNVDGGGVEVGGVGPLPVGFSCHASLEPEKFGDNFRMYWYPNQGPEAGFFDLSQPHTIASPIPLTPNVGDSSSTFATFNGGHRIGYNRRTFTDINGDGMIDAIWADGNNNQQFAPNGSEPDVNSPTTIWSVSLGDGKGGFHRSSNGPYPWFVPKGAEPSAQLTSVGDFGFLGNQIRAVALSQLIDVNGDGLSDLVYHQSPTPKAIDLNADTARIYLNTGVGFQYHASNWTGAPELVQDPQRPIVSSNLSAFEEVSAWTISMENGVGGSKIRFSDFDSDGRPDLVSRHNLEWPTSTLPYTNTSPARLYINPGLGTLNNPVNSSAPFMAHNVNVTSDEWIVTSDFLDLDGDGQPENVSSDGPTNFRLSVRDSGDQPLRLLNEIDNGQGGITEISYAAQNAGAVATSSQSGDAVMPSHLWVVKDVQLTDNVSSTVGIAEVKYGDPVWNQNDRGKWGFRGFESIETSHVHAPGDTQGFAVTERKYDYDLDWSGRQVETVVYADGFPTGSEGVASITRATHAAYLLFGGTTVSYLLDKSETRNCRNITEGSFQGYAECTQGPPTTVHETIWKSLKSDSEAGANPELAYYDYMTTTYGALGKVNIPGTQFGYQHYILYSDASHYWRTLYNIQTRVGRDTGGQFYTSVRTLTADETHRYNQFAGSYGVVKDNSAISSSKTVRDINTGLVTEYQDPKQLNTAFKILSEYSGFRVQPDVIKNYKGFPSSFTYDLGTGAVLATRGPNPLNCNPGENGGSRTEYDGLGRPLRIYEIGCTDGNYDPNRLLSSLQYVEFDGSTPAHVITTAYLDDINTTVSTTYADGTGRTIRTVLDDGSPEGVVSRALYSARGQLERHIAADPSAAPGSTDTVDTSYAYDSLGRATSIRYGTSNSAAPTPGAPNWDSFVGVDVSHSFDGTHSIKRTTEHVTDNGPAGETITYSDFLGRLTKVEERLDSGAYAATQYEYDGNKSSQIVGYPYKPVLKITDADGVVTEIEGDLSDHRTKVKRNEREWSYHYDNNGNLTMEIAPHAAGANSGLYSSITVYDELDRPKSRVLAIRGLDAEQQATYDANTVEFEYDSCGKGRLCSVASGNNLISNYIYDWAGRVIEDHEAITLPETVAGGPDFSHTRTSYIEYNRLGAVTDTWLADGADKASSTQVSYDYNPFTGIPETLVWNGTAATVLRNNAQRVTQLSIGCLTRNWAYDHRGRVEVTEVIAGTGLGSAPGAMACTSTADEPILSESMSYFDSSEVRTQDVYRLGLGARNFDYTYDSQHQLVGASNGNDYAVGFAYSHAGRMRNVDGLNGNAIVGREALSYDDGVGPQLSGYGDGTLAGGDFHAPVLLEGKPGGDIASVSYSYDASGNVISRDENHNPSSGADVSWTFSYDGTDQQREVVVNGDEGRELYYYDSVGTRYMAVTYDNMGSVEPSRIRVWNGGVETWYVPGTDGMIVDAEYAHVSFGGVDIRIKTEQVLGELVRTAEATFANGLGHLMGAVDWETGATSAAYVYGPYGEILASDGAEQDTHLRRFNGKEADQLSKLSYYGYRYYDSLSLSWTQADPMYLAVPDLAGANPREMTLYTFSMNNPLRYLDPDGLAPGDPVPGDDDVVEGADFSCGSEMCFEVKGSTEEEENTAFVVAAKRALQRWHAAANRIRREARARQLHNESIKKLRQSGMPNRETVIRHFLGDFAEEEGWGIDDWSMELAAQREARRKICDEAVGAVCLEFNPPRYGVMPSPFRLRLPTTVRAAGGVRGNFSRKGYTFRIDTKAVARGEGGFHIHVFRNGVEKVKVSGRGAFVKMHNKKILQKPSELNKGVKRELNRLIRHVQKKLD